MKSDFKIRGLTENDIKQMAEARREQENENGNGASDEYIIWYEKILKDLFEKENIIATGAFKNDELVSIACFNLISFGSEKRIPYLCAVWTNPEYRGMGLASKVYTKLIESILDIKERLQPRALLTLEGNEAALRLYKRNGYEDVSGEMTFLGDVSSDKFEEIECQEIQKDKQNKSAIYCFRGKPAIEIQYSEEQFFSHPTNLDGKMNRIISIKDLQGDAGPKTINIFLQLFFSTHRFCKFNVQELAENEKRLYEIFGAENDNMEALLNGFEQLKFKSISNQALKIKRSFGIMEKNLSKEFAESGQDYIEK